MKKDIQQILTEIRKLTPYIKDNYHTSTIEVFGSYIKKLQNPNSDLDILVTFSKTPSLIKFIELENFLSDKLGIKVDLVMKDSLKPRLRNSIIDTAVSV